MALVAISNRAPLRTNKDRMMCIPSSPIVANYGVFLSFFDLQAVIKRFVAQSNDIPKPFVGTADRDKIIAAIRRVPNVRFCPLGLRQTCGRTRSRYGRRGSRRSTYAYCALCALY